MRQFDLEGKKLKVTLFSYVFWPETFVVNDLIAGLIRKGHQVEVSTSLPNYQSGSFQEGYSLLNGPYSETWNNSIIKRFPVVSRKKGFLALALNYLTNIIFGFLNLFRLRKSDVVFVYGTSPLIAFLPAVFFKRFFKVPMVIWYQDLWPESFFAVIKTNRLNFLKPVLEWIVRFIYSQTDVMLMQNHLFNDNLERLGFSKRKLTIYNWSLVDETLAAQVDIKGAPQWISQLPQDKKLITFAGNIGKVQGINELLKVAMQIEKSHAGLHFVFVGEGSFLEDAKKVSQNLANITWIDRKPLEDMPYLFAKSDIMIVSLSAEPAMSMVIPGKLQAYFAAGKPVIGFINGAAADIIKEAKAGFVASAENTDELIRAIDHFAAMTKSDLDQLGQNARVFYECSFSKDRVISQIESELISIVEKYRRR